MSSEQKRGRPRHDDILTPAEWKVVRAAQHGLTNARIAEKQGVSINAVKFHVANAVAKLGVQNKKELLQWLGAPKGSAVNAEESIMKDEVSFERVGQIARTVSDVKKSEAWYRDVLGLQHLYTFGTLAFFECGRTRLMLSGEKGTAEAESVIYLTTPDIKASYAALQAKGARFTHAPHMIHKHEDGTEEWMAFIEDPDGRPIGLMATYPSN